ncbi:MAG: hypothetical protein JWP56_1502 [Aeromicrobium sp.]|nr:hypothetical protein [Aeromicrobium sp.]
MDHDSRAGHRRAVAGLWTRDRAKGTLSHMMTSVLQRVTVSSSLIVGGLVLMTTAPASAAVCTSGVEGDVNGDGYAEVAVSEAGRTYGKGAVHVFYGRPKGLAAAKSGTALDDQYLDQAEPGVAGSSSDYEQFGSGVAFGDYNDDGCADLAVGATAQSNSGSLFIFYGSKAGLRTTGSTRITYEQLLGAPGTPIDQGFGYILQAGDLNDDGVTDLALGVPVRPVGDSDGRGTVAVLLGGSGGLSTTQKLVLDRSSAGIPAGEGEVGKTLAIGDFDGNGIQELAIAYGDGLVQIVEGTSGGLVPSQGPLTGPSLGIDDFIPDHDGEGEYRVFGDIMVAGDVDADGRDDLAVGMPAKGLGGSVAVVKGSSSGLTAAGVTTWDQGDTGVVGTPEEDDSFGASLAMGRLDAGPTDDLAIGVPYDTIDGKRGAGSAIILLGSSSGLTTAGQGGARYHQNSPGVPGTAELQDVFGRALTIANVQSRTQGSLIIGAPREKIGTIDATGQFHQLSIMASGPRTSGSTAFNLDSTGVRGASRKEAELGRALD